GFPVLGGRHLVDSAQAVRIRLTESDLEPLDHKSDQYMTAPAATLMSWPVRLPAAGEHRNTTTSTTSVSLTVLLKTVPAVISARSSSGVRPRSVDIEERTPSSRSPSTSQGETRLTVIPSGPTSWA